MRSYKEIVDLLSFVRGEMAQFERQKDKISSEERIAWYNFIRANKTMLEWVLGFNNYDMLLRGKFKQERCRLPFKN